MPLKPLRDELRRVCEASPQWDGRVAMIQVTDANERAIQLRVLVSAGDAGRAWDLRSLVRERLVDFVCRQWPQFLPRVRADVQPDQPKSG